MADPVLDVAGLRKAYRDVVAVDGVDVQVGAGEVVALLGPNGAGKSTTLRICAGVGRADAGRVVVAGVPIGDSAGAAAPPPAPAAAGSAPSDVFATPLALAQPRRDRAARRRPPDTLAARRQLGYVPDVGGLFPRLTGWEHLAFAARVHGLDPDGWPVRARELIDALGLTAAAGRRAATYSHGMARKLSLAIALLHRPRLLLLDEPFDGVDPAGARAVRELVAAAVAAGSGVLISTHLLDTAERISDRLVVIRAGRVLAAGPAAHLRARAGTTGPLEEAYLALMADTGAPLVASG